LADRYLKSEQPANMIPIVRSFYDKPTGSWTYLVADPASQQAAIIDPVLDYYGRSGRTGTAGADALVEAVQADGLSVRWILETHAHADHLSSAHYLKRQLGAPLAIGSGIVQVQETFKRIYGLGPEFVPDGSHFDRLLADGERLPLGDLEIRIMATPGHTNDSVTYLIGDAAFVGDTLFMPDSGSARCDFPGGSAARLYRSVMELYSLPSATRIFVGHDYMPGGRAPLCESTVAAERAGNIHVHDGIDLATYVAMREARDATLDMPNLILPAIQVNIRAGRLPPAEADGVSYLRIPVNVVGRPL
jgi:glyoxylase-like metal-dependent hydrolase (beta-lactamase superfamily II)